MKIVLLPGLDGTGRLFAPLLECASFPGDYLVVRYEDVPQTVDELAATVESLLPEGESIILIAESFSSLVALRLLERQNIKLAGILFVVGFVRAPRRFLIGLSRLVPISLLRFFATQRLLVRLFFLSSKIPMSILDLYLDVVRNIPAALLKSRIEMIYCSRRLPSFQNGPPVGYLRAKKDLLISRKAVADFEAVFPDVFVREVDGPHFILQAQPLACLKIIQEFMLKVTGSRRV